MLTLETIKKVGTRLATAAVVTVGLVTGANAALDKQSGIYTVESGDTYIHIADATGIADWRVIQDANNGVAPRQLQVGTKIDLSSLISQPAAEEVQVASVDSAVTETVVADAAPVAEDSAPATEEVAVAQEPVVEETAPAADAVETEADEPVVEENVAVEEGEEPAADASTAEIGSAEYYAELLANAELSIEEKIRLIEENCAEKMAEARAEQAEAQQAQAAAAEADLAVGAGEQLLSTQEARIAELEAALEAAKAERETIIEANASLAAQAAQAHTTAEAEQAEADAALAAAEACAETCTVEEAEEEPEIQEEATVEQKPVIEEPVAEEPESCTITVQRGDGFEKLAVRHGVTIASLIEANDGRLHLNPGDKLDLSACDTVPDGSAIEAYKEGLTNSQTNSLYPPPPPPRVVNTTPRRTVQSSTTPVRSNVTGGSATQGHGQIVTKEFTMIATNPSGTANYGQCTFRIGREWLGFGKEFAYAIRGSIPRRPAYGLEAAPERNGRTLAPAGHTYRDTTDGGERRVGLNWNNCIEQESDNGGSNNNDRPEPSPETPSGGCSGGCGQGGHDTSHGGDTSTGSTPGGRSGNGGNDAGNNGAGAGNSGGNTPGGRADASEYINKHMPMPRAFA